VSIVSHLGALTFWNPRASNRPAQGLCYLYNITKKYEQLWEEIKMRTFSQIIENVQLDEVSIQRVRIDDLEYTHSIFEAHIFQI
jgi:hypothetical protein